MNRNITNTIRFLMDECVPALIRDSKWFMYPFYFLAYRGKNINQTMDFKKRVYAFSKEEYAAFYKGLNSISRNRTTDLNKESIDFILNHLLKDTTSLLDVGCSSGFLLNKIHDRRPDLKLTGLDIKNFGLNSNYTFVQGNIESIPFENQSFDIVVCSHTIEHLLNLEHCIAELLRVCKKQLFIVTPCQRYFYYTLDEHVNFFPFKEKLTSLFPIKKYRCEKLKGDWVYLGELEDASLKK